MVRKAAMPKRPAQPGAASNAREEARTSNTTALKRAADLSRGFLRKHRPLSPGMKPASKRARTTEPVQSKRVGKRVYSVECKGNKKKKKKVSASGQSADICIAPLETGRASLCRVPGVSDSNKNARTRSASPHVDRASAEGNQRCREPPPIPILRRVGLVAHPKRKLPPDKRVQPRLQFWHMSKKDKTSLCTSMKGKAKALSLKLRGVKEADVCASILDELTDGIYQSTQDLITNAVSDLRSHQSEISKRAQSLRQKRASKQLSQKLPKASEKSSVSPRPTERASGSSVLPIVPRRPREGADSLTDSSEKSKVVETEAAEPLQSTERAGESPTERNTVEGQPKSDEACAPISATDKERLAKRKRVLTLTHAIERVVKGARDIASELENRTKPPDKENTNGRLNKKLIKIKELLQALRSIPHENPMDHELATAVHSSITPNTIVYGDSTVFKRWRSSVEKLRRRYQRFFNTLKRERKKAVKQAKSYALCREMDTNMKRFMRKHVYSPIDDTQVQYPDMETTTRFYKSVFRSDELHNANPATLGPIPEEIFKAIEPNLPQVPESVRQTIPPITKEEVEKAIKHAKNGTVPGLDGIPIEIWKLLMSEVSGLLAQAWTIYLKTGQLNEADIDSISKLLPKRSPASSLEKGDFRPITLEKVIFKLFTSILASRVLDLHEKYSIFSTSQKGFVRNDRGILEASYTIQAAVDHSRVLHHPLYILIADYRNAFGSVWHELILFSMELLGYPHYMINIMKFVFERARTAFQQAKTFSEWLAILNGVLQGDSFSPILFNTALEVLLRFLAADTTSGYRFYVAGEKAAPGQPVTEVRVNHQAVADDVTGLADTEEGLHEVARRIRVFSVWAHMVLRPKKCKIVAQVFTPSGKRIAVPQLKKPVMLGGQPIRVLRMSETTKLLGLTVQLFRRSARALNVTPSLDCFKERLQKLSDLPIFPWQKMKALIQSLIPTLDYLVANSTVVSAKQARELDGMVRTHVRKWMGLPPGFANSRIYARQRDGGHGVPSIEQRLHSGRISGYVSNMLSSDPVVRRIMFIDIKNTQRLRGLASQPDPELVDALPISSSASPQGSRCDNEVEQFMQRHGTFPSTEEQRTIAHQALISAAMQEASTQKISKKESNSYAKDVNAVRSVVLDPKDTKCPMGPSEPAVKPSHYRVYSDGSALRNGSGEASAGYGAFYGFDDERNFAKRLVGPIQTNQRAEMSAIIDILERDITDRTKPNANPKQNLLDIATDSTYCIGSVLERIPALLAQGFTAKKVARVANADLVVKLVPLIEQYASLTGVLPAITKVPAHSSVPGNEIADVLAKHGATLEEPCKGNSVQELMKFIKERNATSNMESNSLEQTQSDDALAPAALISSAYPGTIPIPHWWSMIDTREKAHSKKSKSGTDKHFPSVPKRNPRGFLGWPANSHGRLVDGKSNANKATATSTAASHAAACGVQLIAPAYTEEALSSELVVYCHGKPVQTPESSLSRVIQNDFRVDAQKCWANLRHQGKAAAYLKGNPATGYWQKGDFITQKSYRFAQKAWSDCLPTPANQLRWHVKSRQPLECPFCSCKKKATMAHILFGCCQSELGKLYTQRHNLLLNRLVKELRRSHNYRKWEIYADSSWITTLDGVSPPADVIRKRPDIVCRSPSGTELILIEITVSHCDSNNDSLRMRSAEKEARYAPLVSFIRESVPSVKRIRQHYLTVGGIGVVPAKATKILTELNFAAPSYIRKMVNFIALDMIQASSRIMRRFAAGPKASRN